MKIFWSALKKLSTVQKQQRPSPNKSIMTQKQTGAKYCNYPEKVYIHSKQVDHCRHESSSDGSARARRLSDATKKGRTNKATAL
jgi:hypothetical protein